MRKRLLAVVVGLLMVAPLQGFDWTKVYQKVVKDNLVWISVGEWSCTGEVVAKDRVLTAAHCFEDKNKSTDIRIYLDQSIIYYRAEVKKMDTYVDLALLEGVTGKKNPITLAESNPIPGSQAAAIGYHGDTFPLILEGLIVASPVKMQSGTSLLPFSHALIHGLSGGPLINTDGQLVGVDVSSDNVIGFAVPVETVRAFLQDKK